ncbi:hypothetical protein VTH06DRAFT_8218 [Thermothelomyces fergusii]
MLVKERSKDMKDVPQGPATLRRSGVQQSRQMGEDVGRQASSCRRQRSLERRTQVMPEAEKPSHSLLPLHCHPSLPNPRQVLRVEERTTEPCCPP